MVVNDEEKRNERKNKPDHKGSIVPGINQAADFLDIDVLDVVRNVRPHGVITESPRCQFLERLFLAPVLDHDPVHGRHQPGTIGPMLAVQQKGSVLRMLERLQRRHHLLISDVPRIDRHLNHPQRRSRKQCGVVMIVPETDHGTYAQRFQIVHADCGRLRATVKVGRNPMQIGGTGQTDWLSPFGRALRRDRATDKS